MAADEAAKKGGVRRIGSVIVRDFGILIIFLVLCVVMALLSDTFLTGVNLMNIARQASALIITAVGMTFVVLSGGIDLSVGSIIGLSGTLAAGFIGFTHLSTPLAVLLAVLVGIAVGLANGATIAKLNIPPFITTLAMLSIARGISLLYTGGGPIYNLPPDFVSLGRGGHSGDSRVSACHDHHDRSGLVRPVQDDLWPKRLRGRRQ